MTPSEKQDLMTARRTSAEAVLAAAVRDLEDTDLTIETAILAGDPGHEICREAAERDVAAIVLGTRGQGGLKRALLGSVSDHVVRNAPCPVVTVNTA
jgi:nucleotide-binding universal stress UspA family protein